jgi:hypothetical protein
VKPSVSVDKSFSFSELSLKNNKDMSKNGDRAPSLNMEQCNKQWTKDQPSSPSKDSGDKFPPFGLGTHDGKEF